MLPKPRASRTLTPGAPLVHRRRGHPQLGSEVVDRQPLLGLVDENLLDANKSLPRSGVNGHREIFPCPLAPHQRGKAPHLADLLARGHSLPLPTAFTLPPLAPFVRVAERIEEARTISADSQAWLIGRLGHLRQRYERLPAGLPACAVHGDAWAGNIAMTHDGPVLLDLERFAVGPPEWDLVSIAVDHFTYGSLTATEWDVVCREYRHDVTDWAGYETLRDIRELRKVIFAVQMSTQYPRARDQAAYRIACIRGERGDCPWYWQGWT